MTNDHIKKLARELQCSLPLELDLQPDMPLNFSALRIAGDAESGLIQKWLLQAPGAVAPEGYMATLHELGHAAYFASHGMRVEVENLRSNLDDYSSIFGRPPPTPYELEQEAFAHRWSFGNAEPGVDTKSPSTFVALSSYLGAALPEDLHDERSLDFMLLIDELGVTTDHFKEWKKGRCFGCGRTKEEGCPG